MFISLKKKILSGMLWASIENFSLFGSRFVITLILARILSPKDFGLIGIISIFIEISGIFIDSGFSQSLIRKQNKSIEDISTIFIFNLVLSMLLYGILFVSAPYISSFFHEPTLTELLRVFGIVLIVNATSIVHNTLFVCSVYFKILAKISFFSSICSGILGIILAYKGYGVWSLVTMTLVGACLSSLMLWFLSDYRPKLLFSKKSFSEMFAFGYNLLLSGILDCAYNNLYKVLIGKFFSSVSLGFYTRAKQFSELPASQITSILSKVTYPILCSIQDNDENLSSLYRKLTKVSCFVIFPIMSLLAGVSTPLILLIIGRKWEYAAALLIPLCFSMMFYPLHSLNLILLKVKGRSDLFLRLELIKKFFGLIILFCTFPFGVLAMCYGGIIFSIIALFINSYYTKQLIAYNLYNQMKDICHTLLLSLITFFLTIYICSLFSNLYLSLSIGLSVGSSFFILSALIFKFDEIKLMKTTLKRG